MGMVRVTSVRIVAFRSSTVSVSADSFTATFQLFRDCRCSECRNCAGAPKRPARAGGLCGSRLELHRSCMTAEGNITRNLVNEASIYAYRTLVTHLYQDGSRRLDADDVIDILDALMAHCSRW